MASPLIIIEVTGEVPSAPGVAQTFPYTKISAGNVLVSVYLSNTVGVTSYFWELVSIPVGSTAVLSDPTLAEPTFYATTLLSGAYLIRCTINSGQSIGTNAVAFLTVNLGLRKFAHLETLEFGSVGWTTALNELVDAADSGGGGGGSGPSTSVANDVAIFSDAFGTLADSGVLISGLAVGNAPYWVSNSVSGLSAEINLGALTTGLIKNTVIGGVAVPSTASSLTDYELPLTFEDSIIRSVNTVTLLNDDAAPGNNYFYGSSRAGVKGFNNRNIVQHFTVGQVGSDVDYTSLSEAVSDAIAGGAGTLDAYGVPIEFEIVVYPGTYLVDNTTPIVVPFGVNIRAFEVRVDTAFIVATNPDSDLFDVQGGFICGLNVSGVTNALNCLFRVDTAGPLSVLHSVTFFNCSTGIYVSSGASCIITNASMIISAADMGITDGIVCDGVGTYVGISGILAAVPSAVLPAYAVNPINKVIKVTDGGELYLSAGTLRVASKVVAGPTIADLIFVEDGGTALIAGAEFSSSGNALHIGSAGTLSEIVTQGANFKDNLANIVNDSSTGSVYTSHSADVSGYTGVSGSILCGVIQSRSEQLIRILGNAKYQYLTSGYDVDLAHEFADYNATGVSTGGIVSSVSGLNVLITAGSGWIRRGSANFDSKWVSWNQVNSQTLTDDATNYVVYDSATSLISDSVSPPGYGTSILLATVVTASGAVRFIHRTRNYLAGPMEQIRDYLLDTRKRVLKSGLAVTAGTGADHFSIDSGLYYIGLDAIARLTPTVDASFNYFYGANGVSESVATTSIDNAHFDSAGTLTDFVTPGDFKADTVIITSDGRVSVIYGTTEYATKIAAEAAPAANTPTFMEPTSFPLALLIIEDGVGIVSIVDIRAQDNMSAGSGSAGVSDHGLLSGLGDDDHGIYLLLDGSLPMSGPLDMGAQNITMAALATVDGVDVSNHHALHDPGAVDALHTGVPASLLVGATAAIGGATSFAISNHVHGVPRAIPIAIGLSNVIGSSTDFVGADHVHAHGNLGAGTSLHAAVSTSVNGFMIAADKLKLDNASATPGASIIPISSAGGNLDAWITANVAGPYPSAVTDRAIAIWNTTAGNLLQNSLSTISATGVVAITGSGASIVLSGSTSGTTTVKSHASPTSWTLTLPSNTGVAGQVLSTNGAGVSSWASPGAGDVVWNSGGGAAITDYFPSFYNSAGTIIKHSGYQASSFLQVAGIQTNSGVKTFNNATLRLAGSTSGYTTLNAAAIAVATTQTFQAVDGTVYCTGGSDVTVIDGGTGVSTHTSGNFLTGNGTGVIQSTTAYIPATKGGTGQTSYVYGDLLYADSATTLARRAVVGSTGLFLKGGTVPNWGQVQVTDLGITSVVLSTTDVNILVLGSTSVHYRTFDFHSHETGTHVYVGSTALITKLGVNYNTAVGYNSLASTSAASTCNTSVGGLAMNGAVTGGHNVAMGVSAGANVTSGTYNIFVGDFAGGTGVTTPLTSTCNIGIGSSALTRITSGEYNTVCGDHSGFTLSSGSFNILMGLYAGGALTTTSGNVFVGAYAGRVASSAETTGVGTEALTRLTSGLRNTAVGYCASRMNLTAADNTAVGYYSLYTSTGASNTAIGSYAGNHLTSAAGCVAVGYNSLGSSSAYVATGSYNTAVGADTMSKLTTGLRNTVVGYSAMNNGTPGGTSTPSDNIAIGYYALTNIVGSNNPENFYNGCRNVAVGSYSGQNLTSGYNNTSVGFESLGTGLVIGYNNVAVGTGAGRILSSGCSNILVGVEAGIGLTTGNNHTIIGTLSGSTLSTSDFPCVLVGNGTGAHMSSNTLVAVGYNAGHSTTGAYNTFIGSYSGVSVTTGAGNTALGEDSLGALVAGAYNTAIGHRALLVCNNSGTSTGSFNTAVGSSALVACVGNATTYTGAYNTAVGRQAGYTITQGFNNICVGVASGSPLTTGNDNIIIGNSASAALNTTFNSVAIGNSSITASEGVAIGSSAVCAYNGVAIGYGANSGTYGIAIGRAVTFAGVSTACVAAGSGINIGCTSNSTASQIRIGTYQVHTSWYNPAGTTVWSTSDERIKEDIVDSELGLEFISSLRPVSYRWKRTQGASSRKNLGFIAQEVISVIDSDKFRIVDDPRVDDPNSTDYMHLAYQDLMAPMVKAIQEQQSMIDQLRIEIVSLRNNGTR